MRDFSLTHKQAVALYEWIQSEYISYNNLTLLNLVKQLREYLSEKKWEPEDD